jgi:cell division protein FtsQ
MSGGARRVRPVVWRRRAVALGAVALVLVAGYYLWLRDSSLVAVKEVEVKGVTANSEEITAALTAAGEDMTTLHIQDDELREAASAFPTVATVRADATLLHKLTVTVTERLPVGVVMERGEPIPVSADGYLLRGIDPSGERLPSIESGVDGARLDTEGLAQASILGGAPDELRERIDGAVWDIDRGGVVVELDAESPELRFGDGSDAENKWEAVAAVLGGPTVGSPAYVDVAVPERSVTGG